MARRWNENKNNLCVANESMKSKQAATMCKYEAETNE